MSRWWIPALLVISGVASAARASDAEPIRCPVTRDTWFSDVGEEADGSNGGSQQLKLKSMQEMSLLDIDPAPLRGRVVTKATLHVHVSGKDPLRRVTVCTFASDWFEGTATGYSKQRGSSTFNWKRYPDEPWAFPGSDLTAVTLGQGGTIWRMADASPPDAEGWQEIPVDPSIVAARVAGISYGFLCFDDTGSEWTRDGEKFTQHLFPNRFIHSRESGEKTAPYFMVELSGKDIVPPDRLAAIESLPGMVAGEANVSWMTPHDFGSPAPSGVSGFLVEADGKPVPRYLIPAASRERVAMQLRDLGTTPGAVVKLSIRVVDGAGNVSAPKTFDVKTSDREVRALGGQPPPMPKPAEGATLPKLGLADVAVIDTLDKVHPQTGAMLPPQDASYLLANHLWDAPTRRVHLHAARNEFVSFQILLRGKATRITAKANFSNDETILTTFRQPRYVASKIGPMPDPLVELGKGLSIPSADDRIEGQTNGSLFVEIYIPHDAAVGALSGAITLTDAEGHELKLDVVLDVWDFTLPDYLSFIPEMNCYGLPENEREYYRLAHVNRTVINRVPYHQNGEIDPGCAPAWDGKRLNFTAWDKRFMPYLDGSAFKDLPRKGVPLEVFYLPLNESWPTPMEGNYNGSYWADAAFPPAYFESFRHAAKDFAGHFDMHGCNDTIFQCFFNGKNNFKTNGWSRGSSPWLLDEPANFQDFWALRIFGAAFLEESHVGPIMMTFRADISRPEWQRDVLDPVLGYNVVAGGAFQRYRRIVLDRKEQFGQILMVYGTTNDLHQNNMQPVGWCLDAWTLGADGVLPWQTVGNGDSWHKADALSLFYPGESIGLAGPVPSVRLKAYLRGEQDVEYLALLAKATGQSQRELGQRVRNAISLQGVRKGTGFAGEDAGIIEFEQLRPQDAWALRERVGTMLSKLAPAPARRIVDFRRMPKAPASVGDAYVRGEKPGTQSLPVARTALPLPVADERVTVIQGRDVVRDTIIDPEAPTKNFGSVARDNRLSQGRGSSALLVRFDLREIPAGQKLTRATVSFYVWDPSSHGKTKVIARALRTAWDESTATWKSPTAKSPWAGGGHFDLAHDTVESTALPVVVEPDAPGADTVDPPIEYQLDVTDAAKKWMSAELPNEGVAIVPESDRAVDDGQWTRFQVFASEYSNPKYTPKLSIQFQR